MILLPIWRRSAAKIWGLIAIIGYRSDATPQLTTVFADCGNYHSDAALRLQFGFDHGNRATIRAPLRGLLPCLRIAAVTIMKPLCDYFSGATPRLMTSSAGGAKEW